jgi:hypothetical protein
VRSTLRRIVVGLILVGLGWVAAKAQAPAPDFEIVVNAPTGQTTVQCVRGCTLMWIARGINPNSQPQPSFTFSCTAPQGCSSSRVGGWLAP